jgi:hypothetical protein
MGLIDFKFLILLSLAIVIFFLYKELELQRYRLLFCEDKIKELKHLTDNSIQNTDFVNKSKPLNYENHEINEINEIQNTYFLTKSKSLKDENKNLSILLPIKMLNQSVKHITESSLKESSSLQSSENIESVKLSSLSENKNSNFKNNSESKIESETKHLEIYSNDNDNNLETTISDSLMVSKTITNLIYESENPRLFLKITNNTEKSDSEQKIVVNDSEQKIVIINNEKSDLTILSKMKLVELQNIAKNKNLNLDKIVNGHQKKKTKQDLIDELSKI